MPDTPKVDVDRLQWAMKRAHGRRKTMTETYAEAIARVYNSDEYEQNQTWAQRGRRLAAGGSPTMPDTPGRLLVKLINEEPETVPPSARFDRIAEKLIAAHIDALVVTVDALPRSVDSEPCVPLRRVLAILKSEQPDPLDCEGFDPNNLQRGNE